MVIEFEDQVIPVGEADYAFKFEIPDDISESFIYEDGLLTC